MFGMLMLYTTVFDHFPSCYFNLNYTLMNIIAGICFDMCYQEDNAIYREDNKIIVQ